MSNDEQEEKAFDIGDAVCRKQRIQEVVRENSERGIPAGIIFKITQTERGFLYDVIEEGCTYSNNKAISLVMVEDAKQYAINWACNLVKMASTIKTKEIKQ